MWYFILGMGIGAAAMFVYGVYEASRQHIITCPKCGCKFEEDV